MAKPVGPVCNLGCSYCFYLEKENLYPGKSNYEMSEKVLESFTLQKIEAHQFPQVTFAWQGGEPTLLGLDFFRKVVQLQQKYTAGKKIENTFQTNGILLNDEWCQFFKENNFLIGLSIDGPENIHNKYRVNKSGKPTFQKVMRGISYLKKHKVEFNTLTVIHKNNAQYPLEIYDFLKEFGSGFMQFVPIVERINDSSDLKNKLASPCSEGISDVTDWSVEPDQYGDFLCAIFDEWVHNDVGKYYVQTFDVALEAWLGYNPGLCVFSKECGTALAIEHNGDLFSCDHYVYPEYRLGNILTESLESLVNSEQQKKFGKDKSSVHSLCQKCEILFACNGDCPKHRFVKTSDDDTGLSYLCGAYKKFFNYIDPYMQFMANELRYNRAPANIMKTLKRE
jgi:uncharacterized protein